MNPFTCILLTLLCHITCATPPNGLMRGHEKMTRRRQDSPSSSGRSLDGVTEQGSRNVFNPTTHNMTNWEFDDNFYDDFDATAEKFPSSSDGPPESSANNEIPSNRPYTPLINVHEIDGSAEESGGGAGNKKHESCVYDRCRHNQLPCSVLHEKTGCKCFSITTEDRPPEVPNISGVAVLNEAEAEISWCSPRSVVREYFLYYQEEGDPRRHQSPLIHSSWRRFVLRDLIPGSSYNVCIVAGNKAGRSSCIVNGARSAEANSPWTRFQTPPAGRKDLFLPIVGSGFVILIIVVLSLAVTLFVKSRRQRKDNRKTNGLARFNGCDFDKGGELTFPNESRNDHIVHLDFGTYSR
uniref:uncharacterized protein n=1 Tax=Myxine glutinosa TaxID=7769 RepID=UPI00358E8056